MGRRTWASEVEKFAKKQLNSGAWSDATAFERRRLLLRIGEDLSKAGVRPRVGSMTVEEVRAYIVWLRVNSGRNSSTQLKALILLDDFLKKQGDNIAAEKLRRQFPPETASDRPRPPFEELVQGFDRLGAIQDAWQRALARGQAALFIGTLVRPSEGRKALYGDLNGKAWEFRVRHPKGKTRERRVPFLNQRCILEMGLYLQERAEVLRARGWNPEDPHIPLFPVIEWDRKPRVYSPQSFNRIWAKVFPGMEHYCARRGMAQFFVDSDPKKLAAVSKILGHSNLQTTIKYYSEIRMDKAASELMEVFKEKRHPEPETPAFQAPKPVPKPKTLDPAYG